MINNRNVVTTSTLEVPCGRLRTLAIFNATVHTNASLGGLPIKSGSTGRNVHADSLTLCYNEDKCLTTD
jgi:hypothetical protein